MLPLSKLCSVAVMAILTATTTAQNEPPKTSEAEQARQEKELKELEKKYAAKLLPNSWFPVADLDLGTHFSEQTVQGTFQFANPTDQPVEWRNLLGSCKCAKAEIHVGDRTYELVTKPRNELFQVHEQNGVTSRRKTDRIEIGPREKGRVVAHLEIPAIPGARQAHMTANTSDPALPGFRLRWRGWSARMYEVSTPRVKLENVQWNETREFTVEVSSSTTPDFTITGMNGGDPALSATWQRATRDGQPLWRITGKFGPATRQTAGAILTFHTDVARQPTFKVNVSIQVVNPITVRPGTFLSLGMVRRTRSVTKSVTITASDGQALQATKLSFEGLTIDAQYVQATTRREGEGVVVELEIKPGAPRGLLKGALLVDLDHDLVKQKRIEFNGFIR